ncbi:MAG: acyl-CoA dehydrogenase family protein [Acidimicrobiia bacterium]|nr:acyl-CoA dehydrogenase family protein [Acidimicrobiia bacterium]
MFFESDNGPERQQMVQTARTFAQRVIVPQAAELDARLNPADCFSWEIVEEASAAGIRTATLSPEYGGAGIDSLTTAMVVEELGRADLGASVVFAQTLKITQTLQAAATDNQRQRYLPMIARDPRFLLAIGITEPDRSSDYIIPYRGAGASFRTNAVRVDNGWRLNGMKHFISNGNVAGLYLVFAQTHPGDLAEGSTCFLVERDTPGFSIGRVHNKMGERLANNAELFFDDCFIPEENVLGEVGKGFEVLVRFFPASNAYAAASVLGTAGAAYDRAISWASERVQGGRKLIDHDVVASDLARMRMRLDAARFYTYQAAWAADHRETGWDPTWGALPKVFASEVAWEVVTTSLEIHGGYGYMRDMGMDKLVRDAAAFLHSDGANRSLLLKAARFIREEAGRDAASSRQRN